MGDLEDGWNDWKRLLIDTQRGSLAQHGLDNEGGQRKRGGGRQRRGEGTEGSRVQKIFTLTMIRMRQTTRKSQTQVEALGSGSVWPGFSPSAQQLILSQPV